jgi:hypothetical protein
MGGVRRKDDDYDDDDDSRGWGRTSTEWNGMRDVGGVRKW